jgi:hypothetical protein
MAEYGTSQFVELWRLRGFFAAVDTSKGQGKYAPGGLRRAAATVIQSKIAETRKELARAQTVLERLDHAFTSGTHGGNLDQLSLDTNMIEFAARMRGAMGIYLRAMWWLSERSYRKASIDEGKAPYTSELPKL